MTIEGQRERSPLRRTAKVATTEGVLCGQARGFNLQAVRRVMTDDKPGRERLRHYVLRLPLAKDRLSIR
jgi:hypothetical protein